MYTAKFLYPEQLPDLHPEQVFHNWLTVFQYNNYIECYTYLQFFANKRQLSDIVQWTFGSFNGVIWKEAGVVLIFVAVGPAVLQRFAWKLNVMVFEDDDLVQGLGLDPVAIRIAVGLLSILMTAAIISLTGAIGFVDLMGPHIAPLLVGGGHRFLIPLSAAVRSILLMAFDSCVVDFAFSGRTPFAKERLSEQDKEIVFGTINQLKLDGFVFRDSEELSGGERPRVLIAWALVQTPRVFLLDEPAASLWTAPRQVDREIIKRKFTVRRRCGNRRFG